MTEFSNVHGLCSVVNSECSPWSRKFQSQSKSDTCHNMPVMVLTPLLFLWENVLTLTAQKGHHKYFSRDSSGSKLVIILLCSGQGDRQRPETGAMGKGGRVHYRSREEMGWRLGARYTAVRSLKEGHYPFLPSPFPHHFRPLSG